MFVTLTNMSSSLSFESTIRCGVYICVEYNVSPIRFLPTALFSIIVFVVSTDIIVPEVWNVQSQGHKEPPLVQLTCPKPVSTTWARSSDHTRSDDQPAKACCTRTGHTWCIPKEMTKHWVRWLCWSYNSVPGPTSCSSVAYMRNCRWVWATSLGWD